MPTIEVTLTYDEVLAALMYWATAKVLNEGVPVDCYLNTTSGGAVTGATIEVTTERMKDAGVPYRGWKKGD